MYVLAVSPTLHVYMYIHVQCTCIYIYIVHVYMYTCSLLHIRASSHHAMTQKEEQTKEGELGPTVCICPTPFPPIVRPRSPSRR